MRLKRLTGLLLLVTLCLTLTACRVRTTGGTVSAPASEAADEPASGSLPADPPEDPADEKNSGEGDGRTKENPDASRKEYDESATAEILAGAEHALAKEGEGPGAFADAKGAYPPADKLDAAADQTATQTLPAEQAERRGVSEDGEEAESALTYYTVLLEDRVASLFECKRLNVYWETAADHVTIHKSSPEHSLILNAGAYDVSARLLAENLRVDDGWIARKNPDLIVKVVDSGTLGSLVLSSGAAQSVRAGLLARDGWPAIGAVRSGRVLLLSEELLAAPYLQTAAMLIIARAAYPELMADVDPAQALDALTEEATGRLPAGLYYYPN